MAIIATIKIIDTVTDEIKEFMTPIKLVKSAYCLGNMRETYRINSEYNRLINSVYASEESKKLAALELESEVKGDS